VSWAVYGDVEFTHSHTVIIINPVYVTSLGKLRRIITMADKCDISEVVSAFLCYSCRLPPRPSLRDVQAVFHCAAVAAQRLPDTEEAEFIPLVAGSIREFYIEPLLPHVGDVDVMFYPTTHLAIPQGYPPPTHLPAEFNDYVYAHDIVDSEFPAFVYLQLHYLLTQSVDDGKYEYIEYEETHRYHLQKTWKNIGRNATDHGPALCIYRRYPILSSDIVLCVHCLSWPPQAADWRTRHRNYDWPDSATVDRVVSNGCDVVHVAHPHCRQHECHNSTLHWRLSFSRAEIVLINSWMPVQQIIYHMLRVYLKTERLTESADNSEPAILSNYHIKTLMLWSCETKAISWWSKNVNLVRICVELLHTLSDRLNDSTNNGCQHYFINRPCNLLDSRLNMERAASKLRSIDEECLSQWMMKNYVKKCTHNCPPHILQLFDDVSTSVKLQNAVSEIVCWRLNTLLFDTWGAVNFAEICVPRSVSNDFLTVRSCVRWMKELTKVDKRLSVYFSAVALLHIARRISTNGLCQELMDILATVIGHSSSQCSSVLSPCKTEMNTVEALQKSAVEHLTTYRQLVARDFGSVATIVATDFEALYAYKHDDHQQCLQLSTENVYTLLYAVNMPCISALPEFIQLMDDSIVSLIALTLIVSPECREDVRYLYVTELTLSLYLMTQCQLKLRHSATSLAQTLNYIEIAQKRHQRFDILDHLTLKYIARKVEIHQSL